MLYFNKKYIFLTKGKPHEEYKLNIKTFPKSTKVTVGTKLLDRITQPHKGVNSSQLTYKLSANKPILKVTRKNHQETDKE